MKNLVRMAGIPAKVRTLLCGCVGILMTWVSYGYKWIDPCTDHNNLASDGQEAGRATEPTQPLEPKESTCSCRELHARSSYSNY